MNRMRRGSLLSFVLVAITLIAQTGVGLKEHICLTQNEKFFGFLIQHVSCEHPETDGCCLQHHSHACQTSTSCCINLEPVKNNMLQFNAECCRDHLIFLKGDLTLVHQPLKLLSVKVILIDDCSLRPQLSEMAVENTFSHVLDAKDSPPHSLFRKFLFFNQLRLDPDLV